MTSVRTATIAALVAVLAWTGTVAGQQPPATLHSAAEVPAAERYEPVFDEFRNLAPRADRRAVVHNLTLRRDVIEFHLEEGELYLMTPVAGRTVAAVFVGHGAVSFAPPVAIERRELRRVLGDSVLASRITAVAFLFTDSTFVELERQLAFRSGEPPGSVRGVLHDALDRVVDDGAQAVRQPTLITALLNGETNAFFYGHVKRERGEDLMFVVDPEQSEQIELLRGGRLEGQATQIVCQFPRAGDRSDSSASAAGPRYALQLEASRIEATIAPDLGFSAAARLGLTARRDGVHWARFLLFRDLHVDSVRAEGGTAATFFRGKRELWLRFDAPLRHGETRDVRVSYHGDLIGYRSVMDQLENRWIQAWTDSLRKRGLRPDSVRRLQTALRRRLPPATDQWVYVKEPETWFPRYAPADPRYADLAATAPELTFHAPARYRLAAVGRLVESRVDGDVATTRWVTERPASEVCFNLGEFDEYPITDPRIPPVSVQVNAAAHHRLAQLLLGQRNPEQDVGGDIANSLAFFTRVYGPSLYPRYYATEIPFLYGEACPGLMYLSMATFQTVNESGREEAFRAHEMAHQWWGIGVEPASYRDVWMSEGFADFSGWWYAQAILLDNEKFFQELRRRRQAIHARRGEAPPIGLGWRVHQTDVPHDWSVMIYEKGAWVLHMLRNLMIDLRTMKEDAFGAMMQDFYQQYRGRHASTHDFEQVVERHMAVPMDWFFNEWVDGTAIPTYILSWHAEPAEEGHYLLHVRIRQEDVPSDFIMPVPLQVEFAGERHVLVRVNVTGPVTEGKLKVPDEPTRLELNPLESVLAEVKTEGWH